MIRDAQLGDVPALLGLIRELADYEREPGAVRSTEADLAQALFPADREPLVHCRVAEVDGTIVAMAIWYVSYSTWEGRHCMYLEDLYVRPAHRGAGIGTELLAGLAAEALRRGFPRLEWWVLHWNTPARDFYGELGAAPMDEWVPYRVAGAALQRLAGSHAAAR